jgi:hypothetical protein
MRGLFVLHSDILEQRTVSMIDIAVPIAQGDVAIRAVTVTILDAPVTMLDRDVALAPPSCRISSDFAAVAFWPQYGRLEKNSGQCSVQYDERSTRCDQRCRTTRSAHGAA